MSNMRLDRFLSNATNLSRSQAQKAIRSGSVLVDGVAVTDAGQHVAPQARVELAGQSIALPGPQYWMLNKPAGYVCAARDPVHRTVLELIEAPNAAALHIAGRLDVDATGLLLLTDDGSWSHRVMSPRREVPKIYRVTLAQAPSANDIATLENGIQLRDEPKPCAPARLEKISELEWRVVVTEGKYHQVKRMFAAIDNLVVALHRERIGAVELDPTLAPGAARPLTSAEVASFGSIG